MDKYIGMEVNINGKEGEIIKEIGFDFYRVDFFDLNKGTMLIDKTEVEDFLVK